MKSAYLILVCISAAVNIPVGLPSNRRGGKENNEVKNRRSLIVLLSSARSGSSFVGSVLKQSDSMFYAFEPLQISNETKDARAPEMTDKAFRQGILLNYCNCDWSTVLPMVGFAGKGSLKEDYNLGQVPDICEDQYEHTVVKTIRLTDITELKQVIQRGCFNVKVIHLVRDPRPVMLSRMKTFGELYDGTGENIRGGPKMFDEATVRTAARRQCNDTLRNYAVGMNPPPWLKERYMPLVYEKIVKDPIGQFYDVFKFIGVPLTDKVMRYIFQQMHGDKGGGGYELKKNAEKVKDEWRGTILPRHRAVIEEECGSVLHTFYGENATKNKKLKTFHSEI